ncbi:hypothetical protein NUU61_009939 [Penicillium alfredii]|uniref:Uncharacterized protein n=1 Tax=Penicillium alfredii TaxID=1506179 RepID=A0A9W9JU57_9EURO|nr:uncharacterized protein NUU61_009939 [Penicillium alfredii]KAJ5081675.1 hypothetical protein NUU61_009939 [Penicillium alfredii]
MSNLPFYSIVNALATTPPELVHQIIDDLRVWDVLRLLCHNNERVNASLLSHPLCRKLLGHDAEALSKTRAVAQFYWDFFREINVCLAKSDYYYYWRTAPWVLNLNIHCVEPNDYKHVLWNMLTRLYENIRQQGLVVDLNRYLPPGTAPLRSFSCFPEAGEFPSFEELKDHWQIIKQAKANLVAQTSSQLLWAADLLEANPDILKRTLDPEQKQRPNTAHIVSVMRGKAAKIVRTVRRAPGKVFTPSEHFRYHFFPIIPFDAVLTELLRLMQKYGITANNQRVSKGEESQSHPGPHSHPPSIWLAAHTLIKGMPYFFISLPVDRQKLASERVANDDGDVFRTGNTPWSDKPQQYESVEVDTPYFTPHQAGVDVCFLRWGFEGYEPHDKREMNWLESFVTMYRYLKSLEDKESGAS